MVINIELYKKVCRMNLDNIKCRSLYSNVEGLILVIIMSVVDMQSMIRICRNTNDRNRGERDKVVKQILKAKF